VPLPIKPLISSLLEMEEGGRGKKGEESKAERGVGVGRGRVAMGGRVLMESNRSGKWIGVVGEVAVERGGGG